MRLSAVRLFGLLLSFLLTFPAAQVAVAEGQQDSGEDIYSPCAACHGDMGQGGKRGEYPRLAGQRPAYLENTLKKFRSRERLNLPMLPYTQERELPDADIKAVAAYIALLTLPAGENGRIAPPQEGDFDAGKRLYQEECAYCHGADGRGKTRFPMLVGQYTNYLQKQIDAYLKGERPHDAVEDDEDDEEEEDSKPKAKKLGVLNRLTEKDIQDILAFITRLQDAR